MYVDVTLYQLVDKNYNIKLLCIIREITLNDKRILLEKIAYNTFFSYLQIL